jgi:hypothetical protein
MRLTKLIAAAALPGAMASPVVAANPAASLSLHSEAAQANTTSAEPAAVAPTAGGFASTPLLIGGLAAILIIVGAIALGHHDSTPASA